MVQNFMRDSNALFILIRSMSKEEKRYFRLYAQRYNRKSNYLRLFDAMERQTVYDEEKLRRQFQGEAFIRRLSVTAEYLYGLILRSLAEQHEDDTPEQQAIALYRRIGVLIHRRMYDQAERFIRRAKELCVHYDLFEELHLVMSLEAYLPGRDRAVLFAELERAMAVYNNNYACGVFAERMRALNEERRVVRTARDRAEIDAALGCAPSLRQRRR